MLTGGSSALRMIRLLTKQQTRTLEDLLKEIGLQTELLDHLIDEATAAATFA